MTPLPFSSCLPATWTPAVMAAAEQLGEALQDEAGSAWPVRLNARSDLDGRMGEPCLTVVSLALDLPLDRPVGDVAEVWATRLAAMPDETRARCHLCTIFRTVGASPGHRALLERIRRLNHASIELSHAFGIGIVDIDRALTFFGADLAQTDYRLQGVRAAEMAGHVIAAALLGSDLCGLVASERQELAVRRHGRLAQMAAVVDRRLQRVGSASGSPGATA